MHFSKHELLVRASVFSPIAHPITFSLSQLSNCGKGKAVLVSLQIYPYREPICHRVSCALLMVACKLALVISSAGSALFREKISDGSGRGILGVWHKPLPCLLSLVHFATLLITKIVTSLWQADLTSHVSFEYSRRTF